MSSENAPFEGLIRLIEHLRSKNGCPWDRKQTPQTLSVYLIEEVYELVDAIQSGDPEAVNDAYWDWGWVYPFQRRYSIGINVQF